MIKREERRRKGMRKERGKKGKERKGVSTETIPKKHDTDIHW